MRLSYRGGWGKMPARHSSGRYLHGDSSHSRSFNCGSGRGRRAHDVRGSLAGRSLARAVRAASAACPAGAVAGVVGAVAGGGAVSSLAAVSAGHAGRVAGAAARSVPRRTDRRLARCRNAEVFAFGPCGRGAPRARCAAVRRGADAGPGGRAAAGRRAGVLDGAGGAGVCAGASFRPALQLSGAGVSGRGLWLGGGGGVCGGAGRRVCAGLAAGVRGQPVDDRVPALAGAGRSRRALAHLGRHRGGRGHLHCLAGGGRNAGFHHHPRGDGAGDRLPACARAGGAAGDRDFHHRRRAERPAGARPARSGGSTQARYRGVRQNRHADPGFASRGVDDGRGWRGRR